MDCIAVRLLYRAPTLLGLGEKLFQIIFLSREAVLS